MNAQEAERIKTAEIAAARYIGWIVQAFLKGEADRMTLEAALDRWLRARRDFSKLAFTKAGMS